MTAVPWPPVVALALFLIVMGAAILCAFGSVVDPGEPGGFPS